MKQQRQLGDRRLRRSSGSVKSVLILSASVVLGTTGMYVAVVQPSLTQDPNISQTTQMPDVSNGESIKVNTDGIVSGQGLVTNGQLRVNNSLVLNPSTQPVDGTAGQFYFDSETQTFRYYNGTSFESFATEAGVKAAIQANKPLPQQPAIITNVVQSSNSVVTEPNNNNFTDVTVKSLAVSGSTDLQGTLRVAGATLLGPTTSSSLILSSSLSVSSGGTGRSSLPSNEIIIGQGTDALSSISNGAPGMCLVSTSGAPQFQACPGASSTGVSSFGGLTGDILLGNSTASGNTVTIDDATTSAKGLASFSTSNFSVTNGAVNTIQDIAVTSAPSFAGLTVSGAATISGQGTFVSGLDVQGASGITALSFDRATAGPLSIGNVNATTINIGTSNVGRQINIGTGVAVQGVTIGSQEGESGVVVQSGNGGVAMYSNGGYSFNTRYGTRPFSISIGGSSQFDLSTNETFSIGSAYGNLFVVDGNNARINLAYNTELNVAGRANFIQGMQISGLSQDHYITPLGTGLNTVINVPNFTVPDYGSILAFGLPVTSSSSARGLLVADARSSSHQPTIGILSPDENNIFGLSFDGQNDVASLKTIGGSGIRIQPAGVDVAQFAPGQIYLNQQTKVSASSSNAFMVQDAASQAVFGIDTTSGSLSIGDSSRLNGSLVVRNATNNYTVSVASSSLTANRSVALGNESGTICLQNSSNCGFVTGSANSYIQNQNSVQQPSTNYWVSGTGRADTALQAPVFDAATFGALTLGGTNATSVAVTQNTSLTAGKTLLITGGATGTRPALPTEGTIYFDTTTKQLIVYTNGKWQADRSTATKIIADGSTSQNPDGADFVVPAGNTSAQTSINAAIAALPSAGGTIFLKEGTYLVSGTINVPSNVTILGTGNASVIKVANATNSSFTVINANASTSNITIESIKIDGNRAGQTGGTVSAINLTAAPDSRVSNIVVATLNGTGVDLGTSNILENSYISNDTWLGGQQLVRANNWFTRVINNRIEWGGTGLTVGGSNVIVSGNELAYGDQEPLNVSGNQNIINNNVIRAGTNYGMQISGTGHIVDGNNFVSAPTLYQTVNAMFSDSRFTNNNVSAGYTRFFGNNSHVSSNSFKGPVDLMSTTNYLISENKFASFYLTFNGNTNATHVKNNSFYTYGGINISGVGNVKNILTANTLNAGTTLLDTGTGTIYDNQIGTNGGLINNATTSLSVNTATVSASMTIQGGVVNSRLPNPAAVTLSNVGTAGTTSRSYQITALDGTGETLPSTVTTTTTSNATLNTSNYVNVTWPAVPGAIQYKLYRCTGASCTPVLLTTLAGGTTSYSDSANGSPAGAMPATNTTGNMSIAGTIQGGTSVLAPMLDTAGATTLGIGTTSASAVSLARAGVATTVNGTLTVGQATTLNADTLVKTAAANSATAFHVQDTSGSDVLNVDTINKSLNMGSPINYTVNSYNAGSGLSSRVDYTTASSSAGSTVADFNGDGKKDIVSSNTSTISFLAGNGDGTFQVRADYSLGAQTGVPESGDINGDGKMDVVVASAGNAYVSVLLGNGNGTFQTAVNYTQANGINPKKLVLADFNGDGKLDVVTGSVSVMLGNGDGTFQAGGYTTPLGGDGITGGDFNGDGKLDVAAAVYGTSKVSLLLGNGDGTFQTKIDSATVSPLDIVSGDFNGDGKLDVATPGSYGADTYSVLLGNGNGTFQTKVDYAAPSRPFSIATTDINNDSIKDIVVLGNNGGLSASLGNGNGTFQTKANYTTANNGQRVISADLNADGKNDIIATANSPSSVSVFMNSSTLVSTSVKSTASITASGTGMSALTLQATSGQAVDVFRVQASDGTPLFNVAQNGNIGIGNVSNLSSLSTKLTIAGGLSATSLYQQGNAVCDITNNCNLLRNTTASQTADINITGTAAFGSSTLVKTTTNSATAFQVQNTTGMSLFTVDTSNKKITIAADTTFSGNIISFSNNIRGQNISVAPSATTQTVTFTTAYPDANYAVFCTPNFNSSCWITNKTTTGFTINYGTAAPADGSGLIDWFVAH